MACSYLLGVALSAHIGISHDLNEIHPMVKLECAEIVTGAYLNSYNDLSAFIGYSYDVSENLKIEAGIVAGYDYYPSSKVLPYTRAIYKDRLFIAPIYDEDNKSLALLAGAQFMLGE